MNDCVRQLRAVLFDFDGTLVNTTPLILRCFHATWEKVYRLRNDEAEYIRTFGIPLQTAMEQMIERFAAAGRIVAIDGHPELTARAAELVETYRAYNEEWHDEMIEPIAGIAETVAELKGRGFRLGIVTSKKRVGVERGLRLYGLGEFFDLCVCTEDTRSHKPHPEPLQRAMDQLAAVPSETLYVGDSTHDIVAGRAAAVATAAATWGPFRRDELAALDPDYLLERPAELLAICGRA